jgi:hypothetical protein
MQVGGSVFSAIIAAKTGAYNSAMAEYDAKQLDDMAATAIANGETEASRVGTQGRQLAGAQRAALAANGVDVSYGTAADIQKDTMDMTGRDMKTVRLNAMAEARGIRAKATATRIQGSQEVDRARAQEVGSLLTGGAQAIGAASNAYASAKVK